MTPRQARVALVGFVFLAAGVAGNALYLQGADRLADKTTAGSSGAAPLKPNPSKASKTGKPLAEKPLAEKPPAEKPSVEPPPEPPKTTQALKVRMVRVATIAGAPQEEADADTVRAVQEELNRRGYGPLAVDGIMRIEARAAIMAFEHDSRLTLTGEASQALLKQLLFGAVTPGDPGASKMPSPHAQAIIKEVQRLLAGRGYRPGSIDGRLSPETMAAIRTFETDQGLVPKGRISAVILERLRSGIAGGGRHTVQ